MRRNEEGRVHVQGRRKRFLVEFYAYETLGVACCCKPPRRRIIAGRVRVSNYDPLMRVML